MSQWLTASLAELHKALRSGDVTSTELVNVHFNQTDAIDSSVKGYLTLSKESALKTAADVDADLKAGKDLPYLAGIPIALKDNLSVKNGITTCGSQFLKNFEAPYTATSVQRLIDERMPLMGKANLDEFAMGSSTENSSFHTTSNPWDLDRVPGGSSGGSAAVVASYQVPVSLGSDTGGSIRQPAAFCGITGLKPTYGRVSRYGLVAFASSLDQIGPFARSAEDAAAVLNVISGQDPADSTSSAEPVPDFTANLTQSIEGLKIGVPSVLLGKMVSPNVRETVLSALAVLTDLGATWEEVDFDLFDYAVSTYYILAPAEASANLARFDGVRYTSRDMNAPNLVEMYKNSRGEGFGPEVQRRIILGTYVLSSGYYDAYYLKAQKVRTKIKAGFTDFFKKYDVMITPTTPTVAFKKGDHASNPLEMYLADIATIPANMAGLPGLSVPAGLADDMPVGLQILGKPFDEETILRVGHQFQQKTTHHTQRPPLEGGLVQ